MEQQSLLSSEEEWQILHTFYHHVANYASAAHETKPREINELYTRVNYLRSMATIHLSTIDQYPSMPSEVDIVLPYCGEDVTWLLDMLTSNTTNSQEAIRDRIIQSSVSLRIYNKCPDRVAASRSVEGLRERLLHVLKDATVNIIMDVMKWAATGLLETLHPRLRFAHLSHNFLSPFWARADRYRTAFKELYSDVMNIQLSMAPEAAELSTYCCTQLLVRDDALRVRSFDYYERLYNRMNSVEIYKVITRPFEVISNDDIKSRLPCQLMMPLWQVIFGNSDDMSTVERPLDPNMPLFLKTANLDGDWVNAILAKNMINHE
ncbi:hypothetical protein FOL46_008534 [Perkinsus olseni]|uniref:Uncharacterized protein n=1 Tax=Perkinsus olseni TaxID=32597 RepID=A0A7J6L6I4_PEROL|nr:hypothetical protein FOL46_008534 [Perkinsus olseni]